MKEKKLLRSAVAVVFAAGLLTAMPALASWATFHGSECQADNWSRAFSDIYTYSASGIANNSTASPGQTLFVTCPITKEVRDDDNIQAYVSVTDQHPTLNISCTLYNVLDSGIPTWSATLSSSGASSSYQNIVFNPPFMSGNWVIKCSIPPPSSGVVSRIHSYHLRD